MLFFLQSFLNFLVNLIFFVDKFYKNFYTLNKYNFFFFFFLQTFNFNKLKQWKLEHVDKNICHKYCHKKKETGLSLPIYQGLFNCNSVHVI